MAESGAGRNRLVAGVALCVGFAGAYLLMLVEDPTPAFLKGVSPLIRQEENTSVGRDTVSYYTVNGSWLQVFAVARKELPSGFVHDTYLSGVQAKVLTVPRIENGRVQLFYPPDREIVFMPGKLALNHKGGIVDLGEPNDPWTGIQMREFRHPQAFDGVVGWFKRRLFGDVESFGAKPE